MSTAPPLRIKRLLVVLPLLLGLALVPNAPAALPRDAAPLMAPPRNWLAFARVMQSPPDNDRPGETMGNDDFTLVTQEGVVIWNDARRKDSPYYPRGPRTFTNGDQWRQGKADPQKLRAFIALVEGNHFFTDDVFYQLGQGVELYTVRMGVKRGAQKRAFNVYGLREGQYQHLAQPTELDTHLSEIYAALIALRPAHSQRYVPKAICLEAFSEETKAVHGPVADWPETGAIAAIPPPPEVEKRIRAAWDLFQKHDTNHPYQAGLPVLSGPQAQVVIDLLAKGCDFRYRGKIYSVEWSPMLVQPL